MKEVQDFKEEDHVKSTPEVLEKSQVQTKSSSAADSEVLNFRN